jgi:hypothetical protein
LNSGQGTYIVYALENGQLVRKQYSGETVQNWSFRPQIRRFRFSYNAQTPQQATLVTLNIELQRRWKTPGKGRAFSMQVALRSKETK